MAYGGGGGRGLEDYVDVAERINGFYQAYPEGSILTELVADTGKEKGDLVRIKTEVRYRHTDERPASTGYAEEIRGSSNVNTGSALENGETSSIGRALANLGFSDSKRLGYAKRPSRQEMESAVRKQETLEEVERDQRQLAARPTSGHKPAAANEPVINCETCGNTVQGFTQANTGKAVTPTEHAANTQRMFGKNLCRGCARAAGTPQKSVTA